MSRRTALVMALSALAVFVLDRGSKLWVLEVLDLGNLQRIDIAAPWLVFVMAWNEGVNFGIGAGGPEAMRWVLAGLAVAISIGLAVWVLRGDRRRLALAAGILIGGALGNAWDRIEYGAVADFLNMSCCGIVNPYAFNVADIAIFLGAIGIAIRA